MATVDPTQSAVFMDPDAGWPARQIMGEFIGTFIVVFISVSGNCIAVANNMVEGDADIFSALILSLAIAAAYFVSGGVSGGHFNPLVTFGFSVVGKFHPTHVLPYILTQFVSAIAAAGLAGFIYKDSLNGRFDNNVYSINVEIASAFAGQPDPQIPWAVFAISTFMASFLLLTLIHAITDKKNMQVPLCLFGHFIGFFAYGIIFLIFGTIWRGGPQINPARDVASRLLNYGRGYELATPWFVTLTTVSSFAGAFFGSFFYVVFEEYQWQFKRLEPDPPVGRVGNWAHFNNHHNKKSDEMRMILPRNSSSSN